MANKISSIVSRRFKSLLRKSSAQRKTRTGAESAEMTQWRFQDLKDSISETQEWRFRDLKDTLVAIDEWRFQDLNEKLAASAEWRFKDLKLYLNDSLPRDTTFTLEQSIADLNSLGTSKKRSIAVISVLPPASTGIARFTAKTFSHLGSAVDFYTPVQNGFEYLLQKQQHNATNQEAPILTLDALPHGISVRDYAALIFVLGNSDHHIPVMRVLRRTKDIPACPPICVEIHDAVVLNLCAKTAQFENRTLRSALQAHSSKDLSSVNWQSAEAGDHGELVSLGLTGFPALMHDLPIELALFHSEAARQIVLSDWKKYNNEKTLVLFHPVFESFVSRATETSDSKPNIRIGTFGVPGRGKLTHLVVEAFEIISRRYPDTSLVIAGYGASQFAETENIDVDDRITVFDSPDDKLLLELMKNVDVAVQLRAKNTGESSGIVPQLIACDVPCICSPIGAFLEYPETVEYCEIHCSSEALANLILEVASTAAAGAASRRKYVSDHSPAKFCDALSSRLCEYGLDTEAPSKILPTIVAPPFPASTIKEPSDFLWELAGPYPSCWSAFEKLVFEFGASNDPYIQTHMCRYRHTLAALESIEQTEKTACLEIGTSWLFALMLRLHFGYREVDVTDFNPEIASKVATVNVCLQDSIETFNAFNINLENDLFPARDNTYDLILCCEVIEHMDVDPMFLLSELNRIGRDGCHLLLTTPNSISSRNVMKIMEGYAPQFFMQYHIDGNPYRHNIEYAPHQINDLLKAAGFDILNIWTANTFDSPSREGERILIDNGFSNEMRGDNLFVLARKSGPIRDRYPHGIYV